MEADERRDELVEAGGMCRTRLELKPQPKLVAAAGVPREAVALRETHVDVRPGQSHHVRARHKQQPAVPGGREHRVEEDRRLPAQVRPMLPRLISSVGEPNSS